MESTTCFYLLMQIDCWLYVVFVLILIIYLFIYSKRRQEKQVEQTTCFYLLMQIRCWLYVVFVLIFIIYLFIYSKRCEQKQMEVTTCFYLLMQIVCLLPVVFILIFIVYLFISSKRCKPKEVQPTTWFYLLMQIGSCYAWITFNYSPNFEIFLGDTQTLIAGKKYVQLYAVSGGEDTKTLGTITLIQVQAQTFTECAWDTGFSWFLPILFCTTVKFLDFEMKKITDFHNFQKFSTLDWSEKKVNVNQILNNNYLWEKFWLFCHARVCSFC